MITKNSLLKKEESEKLKREKHKRTVSDNFSYLKQQIAIKRQNKMLSKINELDDYKSKYENLPETILCSFPKIIGAPEKVKKEILQNKQKQINLEMQNTVKII